MPPTMTTRAIYCNTSYIMDIETSASNATAEKTSWLSRLKKGLAKTSGRLAEGITGIFTRRKLDKAALEELEELLISTDIGVQTAGEITAALAKDKFDKDITPEEIRQAVADHVASILAPLAVPVDIDSTRKPYIVLVVGVNGNGKTTTIGKMAHLLQNNGWKVMLAAADTFRAAAASQLDIWAQRAGCEVIAGQDGGDAASVAYRAIEEARAKGADVLLVDTAGRLQNKSNLMAELEKIVRVIKKLDADAPHATLQILDATTGQNAHSQVETFRDMVKVTGLVVTKLDGTARGGVVVGLARKFNLPIHAIGVGEGINDLREFKAEDFARSLAGV